MDEKEIRDNLTGIEGDGGSAFEAEVAEPEHDGGAGADVPVVAIGASAGGLDVFKLLLADLPADTGLAIVFIQHLDPNHHSMLAEILSRATAIPVSEVTDGTRVEADHVYVMPANVDMTIAAGELKLVPRTRAPGAHMPIDLFLRSVADQCASRAIGVILSGTGSDGAAGVEAIKAAGGVTFAQDGATAKFASMPRAAIETGCVDFALPPEGIAAELVRIGRHPYMTGVRPARPRRVPPADEEWFGKILATVREATHVDFSQYRESLVKRRILRRLALRNIKGLGDYSEWLRGDSEELSALQRDLLISVTSFFRDRESFDALRKLAFPRILQDRPPNETIRIWVAGCATGEEAFSVAISLQECLNDMGAKFPVQIFASDINMAAIEKARNGRFSDKIVADLTAERLNRHFTKIDGGYQINKDLREMCVFAKHNVIDDPPFSKLDLITCRNVLIYLANAQMNIIPRFHYALKAGGVLMLGASEAAASDDLFSPLDREHRIYLKRETTRKPHLIPAASRSKMSAAKDSTAPPPELWGGGDVRKEVDRILLSKYSPAGVVVDEELEVVEIRGQASPYLALPAGKVSFNLVKLIPNVGLLLAVEKLIQEVRRSGESARMEAVPYDEGGSAGALSLEVVPLDSSHKRSTLVLFEPLPVLPAPEAPPAEPSPEGDAQGRQIARLKRQLADAKQRFLSAIEESQTSREESHNTTEEALSANEELQSLNEELETVKEELQSTNEELLTVNDELQVKNTSLARARDFAMAIVETVRQPLLVLDSALKITLANQAFYRTFRVSPLETEGQLIYALSRGGWNLPGLRDALAGLLSGGNSFPDFEVEQDFPALGRRCLVVGGCRIDYPKMILLAVDDITGQKDAQQALRKSQEHLRQSQKMEAVGRLAGGIAHDFNNLLTVILGYSGLMLENASGNKSIIEPVLEIKSATERAASLTKQLLAFSRGQMLQPKVLDLNAIVADFERMLRHLTGERIKVDINCEPALWHVKVDPGEIGRALMNLSLNARDAMPEGGKLTIETANLTLTETTAADYGLQPGRYAMIAVRDTGIGMDEELRAHIFEPFFTTKEIGKGTGLGLPTVLGIVEQSGGAIRCESEAGAGTTFGILLPAIAQVVDRGAGSFRGLTYAPRGTEVVLLVEDEAIVRSLARRILEASGYVVLEAANGREGLALCATHDGQIDLILSDVVMPEVGGRELVEGALKLRPGVKVLFMSGHTQDAVLKEGIVQGTPFLQKPFTVNELACKVRETLDADRPSAGSV